MPKSNKRTRRYCFTIFNYTDEELQKFHNLAKTLDKHRYICYGLEISPDTGAPHIQGYIELENAQRFTYLHRYFAFKRNGEILRFHVEMANGTAEENLKYVSKGGNSFEFGEPTKMGQRNDLEMIKEAVKENPKAIKEIIEDYGNNLQQIKYAQSLQPYYFEHRNPDNPPKVYWIYGKTGIGKTSLVYKNFKDVCSVSSYDWLGTGYLQNECLLLDDFRQNDIRFNDLLKITDRYPYTLFFKGGSIPLNSPYIIFTSPENIDTTFDVYGEDINQLKRRVKQINLDKVSNLDDVNLKELSNDFVDNVSTTTTIDYEKINF